jgi:hypothetical protein
VERVQEDHSRGLGGNGGDDGLIPALGLGVIRGLRLQELSYYNGL